MPNGPPDRPAPLPPAEATLATQAFGPDMAGATTSPAVAGDAPAVAVPGYEVLGELGRGGMGVVYKARHRQLDRVVALKMLLAGGHAGSEGRARFRTEAVAVARLHHPNIGKIHEVGEADGMPYLCLEYVGGGSLSERLSAPWPAEAAAALVETLARAVDYAHRQGVVHRDLKPANVLLSHPSPPSPLPGAERGARR